MTREKGKNQRDGQIESCIKSTREKELGANVFLQLSHLGLEKKRYKAAGDFKTE